MKTNSPKTATKKKAIKPAKKAAKKGRAKSAETGKFVKKEYAAKNKATTFTAKPSKNDKIVADIKRVLKTRKFDEEKFSIIKKLIGL